MTVYKPTLSPIADAAMQALPDATWADAASGKSVDLDGLTTLQDAIAKKDGKGPEADVMLTRFEFSQYRPWPRTT